MNQISNLLLKLGIHKTCLGFRYLVYILELCLEDEDHLLRVSHLYGITGTKFHSTAANVESCIRTAVSACWNRGNRNFLMEIAPYELTGKPSSSEFLDILYGYLTSQERE